MNKIIIVGSLLILTSLASAHLITGVDKQATLPYWEWKTSNVSIRFVQRLPDQSRAYFAGRGFQQEDIKLIEQFCIFQSVFKNISTASSHNVIDYDLSDWQIHYKGQVFELKTREYWRPIWKKRNTAQAQKIAFEWSLLPTIQQYKPADYNWGMTVFPVAHGAKFNLHIKWKINGDQQQAVLKNMQCAKDIYIPPGIE